ncbi:MAG TPA: hypothetical protein VM577_02585 [Anaerovoracaceae bacterium]|nr:hypothetical protein [Anaerovoracaceae bacterium]
MLTPMMVQYLVGLCCLRHESDAIDVTLGDMIYDTAAGKSRDVDVTVTIQDANGDISAFKAAEVKAESKPLDVEKIEQLCLKLTDMPQVTHRSIFSSSGYTDGAKAKAKAHSVDLYTLKQWNKPIGDDFIDFEGLGTPDEFLSSFERNLLYWVDYNVSVVVPKGPASIPFDNNTAVLKNSGKKHNKFCNMGQFIDNIVLRSTGILCTREPAVTVLRVFPYGLSSQDTDFLAGPPWPHTHTLDVIRDEVYLQYEDGFYGIDEVTITGKLQWRLKRLNPEFLILENVFTQKPFAGAAIADYDEGDGRMFVMVFPEKGRTLGVHPVCIPEKQRNMIRNLKIL